MSSLHQGLKETRCSDERAAAVPHRSVSGVNNAGESNKSLNFPSGHHAVTANVTLRSTGQFGGHPKSFTLYSGGQAHARQSEVADIVADRDIAEGVGAVRGGPIKQCRGAAYIPHPVRRFTTTNPNTLSPTYHLFYDLTKHLPRPSVPGDLCSPHKPTSKSAPGRTVLSHSVPNYGVSGEEFSDESNMTLGQRCTSKHHIIPSITGDKLLNGEINQKPQTTSNFTSDILSHHQESMCGPTARQTDVIEGTDKFPQETPLHRHSSDSKFADINANTSYGAAWVQNTKNIFNNSVNDATRRDFSQAHNRPATNISAPVVQKQTGLPARQWKSREEKTQIQRDEQDRRDQSYALEQIVDRVPCLYSNNETGHTKVNVTQTLANEEDTNVTVSKAVHFWNSNAADQENSSPGPPLKPDKCSSENFKTFQRGQASGEDSDAKHWKRAVFKREGDSVRMFMVSDDTLSNHDSRVASDPEIFPGSHIEKPAVPMSLTDHRKNSSGSLLSLPNFLLESFMSKSKKRGPGATKDNDRSLRGVVTINNDLLNGGGNCRVSKNQVNRWNNLHVRSAPSLSAGVDREKRKCATKEKLSAQSGLSTPALDSHKPALGRDPACHRSLGGEGGRTDRADNVGPNGPSKSAIKGILVNKDNVPTGYRSGHTHKANTVQFSEDPHNTEDNLDSSETLKRSGELVLIASASFATSRKEVIDRNKYIIKRSLVTDGQNNLNPSRDTPRSASADSLDNFYPAGERIAPRGNSLEKRDSSVKCDAQVDVRQSTLESPVALESRRGQSVGVITASHANLHSSELSCVDNSGFRTGDTETYTQGLHKLHENSSPDRAPREQQGFSQLLDSHSSRAGRNQLRALDHIKIALSHNCNFETVSPITVDRTATKCVDVAESRLADLASIKNKDKKECSNERRDSSDLSPPSRHHPSEQQAPQKIRPRQKFEIRHNKISGKVGAQLRLNSQVNGDAGETKYHDEDIGSDPANVTLSPHKETPRARFERDRAARSHAVTTGELTTDSLCERYKGDHKSDGGTLLLGSIPTSDNPVGVIATSSRCSGCIDDASSPPELPPPKLPPRVKLANKPLATSTVVSNRDSLTDKNSISLNGWLQLKPDIKPNTSEAFVTRQQQHAENTWTFSDETFLSSDRKYNSKDNYFIAADTQEQRFPHLDCANSDKENTLNRNSPKDLFCDSKSELTTNSRSHIVDDSRQSGYEGTTVNTVENKSLNNLITQTEILSSAHHFGDSGFERRAAGDQRVSASKKASPDSASSSGYDSEVNTSAIKTFFQGFDCVSNNEYIRQVLTRSSVQQLRLLFGHEDDHQESVKPQRPRDTGVLTSPPSRWRPRDDFNANDVAKIYNCSTDGDPQSYSPIGDATHRVLEDGFRVNSSRKCQDNRNKEADNSSDSFHNVFPECRSHDSPRQYLGTESVEEYDPHSPWPLQCAPCEDWLDNCGPSPPRTVLCPQTKGENFNSSSASKDDFKDITKRNCFAYIRALVVSEAEAEMLASKGIRIYESGEDYVAMVSPVKSPLHKSLSSPQFVWEGTTYLIIPTVLDPLGTSAVQKDSSAAQHGNNNPDLFTHRSYSDSGAPGHFIDNARVNMNDAPVNDQSDVYLTMTSSGSGKLTEQSRAMSVEVLCTKDVRPNENWEHATPSVGLVRRRKNKFTNDRGYVEWKTCSGWVGNTDMRTASDCRNSQGYVEWDTIWTTAAPWCSPTKGDEHVYDVIAEDQGPQAQNTPSSPANGTDNKDLNENCVDTPPALPERTYIHRIKNINAKTTSHNQNVGVRGASTPPSSRQNHPGHPSHNCGCVKHHHHHHHHHHSGKHHRSPPPLLTSGTASTNLPPTPSPFSGQQHKHTGGVHSPTAAGGAQMWPSPGDPSQNYAEVNKLRGYTFSNLMLATDSPAPHHPDKTAISSENYWHLAPMTSPDSVTSWQTGDVLDYIDGLHDSMSPKRRENIYILLNNKKTRAKFSESLEIESRLLSRGLISNSCEGPSDKAADVPPKVKSGTVKPVVIRRKGAIAPVSSTYV